MNVIGVACVGFSQATYSRDKLGRILTTVETVAGETRADEYGYDSRGRLVEVKQDGTVTPTFDYDANGNRLVSEAETARYDNQDRLLQKEDKPLVTLMTPWAT